MGDDRRHGRKGRRSPGSVGSLIVFQRLQGCSMNEIVKRFGGCFAKVRVPLKRPKHDGIE